MASIYVIRGKDVGRHFLLKSESVRMGRDADNEFQLVDTEVSRHHAAIVRHEDRYEIIDLQSSNGTFLNSRRVQKQDLKNGDRLQIGRTLLIFTSGNELPEDHEPSDSSVPHDVDIVRNDPGLDFSRIVRAVPSDHASVSASWKPPQPTSDELSNASSQGDTPSPGSSVYGESSFGSNHWEVVYRTALAVSRTLDIDQLVAQILDLIFQTIECDRGCILLMDEEAKTLQPVCRKDRREQGDQGRLQISKTILDYVIEHSEGVYSNNAQEDGRWDPAGSIVQMGIREAICVPMQGRYGVVGAIYIDTSTSPGRFVEQGNKGRFTEDHLKLMVAIGNQAALAVEDTSYYRGMVQSERLAVMGQTIATLSHHIKNILQGIRGGSYLVNDGLAKMDLDAIARGWKIVDRNQDRIAALVMDMLTFSKDRIPELKPTDPRLLLDDIYDLVQSRASEQKAELEWKRPAEFPLVEMDSEAMHRAVLNIVTNAVDAVQGVEQGRVKLGLEITQGGDVVILIDDNGSGIPEDQQAAIFSMFASSKGSRGTGLGLPVSRKILREHGGDIELESQPGVGTRFRLRWPFESESTRQMSRAALNRPTSF